ncbi:MAG: hypothetical protein OHK93_008246 [Ramalina farinacea]|uniref:Uncharacterized protein n=1 Tax=Ramalina farinacea TaxID=258253 RepID=A0AA43TV46_9LECA|nr:hypothetical protein [Ramalina farinacea]
MRIFPKKLWRSLVEATPVEKRSYPLERRKDKADEGKFITQIITQTETTTVSQYFTISETTTIISKLYYTVTSPIIVDHTTTMSAVQTTTVQPSSSSMARVAPELAPSDSSASTTSTIQGTGGGRPTTGSPTAVQTASPATAAPQSSPSISASTDHKLSTTVILGIVLGCLAFLAALIAGLLFARRMYRMYRQQRVMRKQIQTEGNEMPNIDGNGPADQGQAIRWQQMMGGQHTGGSQYQGYREPSTMGGQHTGMGAQRTGDSKAAEAREEETWQEYPPQPAPPAYSTNNPFYMSPRDV